MHKSESRVSGCSPPRRGDTAGCERCETPGSKIDCAAMERTGGDRRRTGYL